MLGEHVFNPVPGNYNDDNLLKILDYKGRPLVDGRTLVGWYIDALVRWNVDSGVPVELLAVRRSEDNVFALCSSCVVTTDEEGSLVVNRDGCRVSVIPGTAVEEGRCALVGHENTVYTLDRTGKLDALQVDGGTLLASVELNTGPSTVMYRDEGTGLLVASDIAARTVCVIDGDLRIVKSMDGLPAISSQTPEGWIPNGGLAVAVSPFADAPAIHWLDLTTGQIQSLVTDSTPRAAVLVDGKILVTDSSSLKLMDLTGVVIADSGFVVKAQHLVPVPRSSLVVCASDEYAPSTIEIANFERTVRVFEAPRA